MNSLKIAYKELDNGMHTFDFKVDSTLFEVCSGAASTPENQAPTQSEVLSCNCAANVELTRSDNFLQCDITIQGEVEVECDRCLEPCPVEIDYEDRFVAKFTEDETLSGEWDGDVMWLSNGESELDLAQYIYESILLDLPYQRVHEEGKCDPEMTKRFKQISYEGLEQLEKENSPEEEKSLDAESLKRLEELKKSMTK